MSTPTNSFTVSRSRRGTTVKAKGTAAQALFEALTSKIDPRLAATAGEPYRIHFEDHGQDFLRWDVDANGVITDSQPYMAGTWVGLQVLQRPEPGQLVGFRNRDGLVKQIKYAVSKVVAVVAVMPTEPVKSP